MRKLFPLVIVVIAICSCKTPAGVFAKRTAHEEYGDRLDKAGLKITALGSKWFDAAARAMNNPVAVQLPYKESGYFSADRPEASSFGFDTKRGEQLTIELTKTPASGFLFFADLFESTNGTPKFIQSIDSLTNTVRYTASDNAHFILRLQPELLQSASYTIVIRTGPSLAYPVSSPGKKNGVISVWGDGRDRGARKHEGIDIGGVRGTPLVAVGDGFVSSVTENNLGGKVVFIRSADRNETWYYAHLDSQIAVNGQTVKTGDVIGLMGNTGNARTTAPHLHFGIYTNRGAIDPLPFVNPVKKEPKALSAPMNVLGKIMRASGKKDLQVYRSPDLTPGEKVAGNLPVLVTAATGNLYKVNLPGGETRFIPASNVAPLEKRIKQLNLKSATPLTDAPAPGAPVIQVLNAGSYADLLGSYGAYQYVIAGDKYGWIIQ